MNFHSYSLPERFCYPPFSLLSYLGDARIAYYNGAKWSVDLTWSFITFLFLDVKALSSKLGAVMKLEVGTQIWPFGKRAKKNEETSYPAHNRARSKANSRIKRKLPRPAMKGPRNSRVTGSFTLDLSLFFLCRSCGSPMKLSLMRIRSSPHSLAASSGNCSRKRAQLKGEKDPSALDTV